MSIHILLVGDFNPSEKTWVSLDDPNKWTNKHVPNHQPEFYKSPLLLVKSPFSYGFPMVFLWFSYGFTKHISMFARCGATSAGSGHRRWPCVVAVKSSIWSNEKHGDTGKNMGNTRKIGELSGNSKVFFSGFHREIFLEISMLGIPGSDWLEVPTIF